MNSPIIALDIGTATMRALALTSGENFEPIILSLAQKESRGMRRGVIIDIEEATMAISEILGDLQRSLKQPIKNLYINVNGDHVNIRNQRGVVAVSRADGEISEEDVQRVIKSSEKSFTLPANRQILHVIPQDYTVDGISGIKNPIDMNGIRLEVESLIIDGFAPAIKNINKTINLLGYKIESLFYNPLLASRSVLTKNQRELGAVLLDFGAGATGMIIFEEDKILSAKVFPIGSANITNDIAIGLKIPVELAEKIKLSYGSASADEISKKEIIDLSKIDDHQNAIIQRRYLAEIIEARLCEICELIKKELKNAGKDGKLPAGAVLSGGGAKMPGLTDLVKKELKLTAQVGTLANLSKETENEADAFREYAGDPSFATIMGLGLWAISQETESYHLNASSLPQKIKKIFKIFLP